MTAEKSAGPPAGWYQDPDGTPRTRWWSGSEWTEHFLADKPTPRSTTALVIERKPLAATYDDPQGFIESISAGWRGYVDFDGFARRPEYWWWYLFTSLVTMGTFVVDSVLTAGVLTLLWIVASFLPTLAISVRRLRDAGHHWAILFLHLVPAGGIVLFVLCCKRNPDELAAVVSRKHMSGGLRDFNRLD